MPVSIIALKICECWVRHCGLSHEGRWTGSASRGWTGVHAGATYTPHALDLRRVLENSKNIGKRARLVSTSMIQELKRDYGKLLRNDGCLPGWPLSHRSRLFPNVPNGSDLWTVGSWTFPCSCCSFFCRPCLVPQQVELA